MKKNNRSHLAYRDTFFAGRVGIRGKILIYLLVLAGFMLSLVWLSQSALLFNIFQRSAAGQLSSTARMLREQIGEEFLEPLAERLGAENDLGIWLLKEDGEVIFAAGRTRYTPFENPQSGFPRRRKTADHIRKTSVIPLIRKKRTTSLTGGRRKKPGPRRRSRCWSMFRR